MLVVQVYFNEGEDMDKLITQAAFMFYAICIAAIFAHALKKWVKGEIRGNLVDWFYSNPRATLGSMMIALSGTAAALLSFDTVDINSGAQVLAIWGIGYAADSAFNGQGKI